MSSGTLIENLCRICKKEKYRSSDDDPDSGGCVQNHDP